VGYSGAGLYDDDAGADVRSGFRKLVADGRTADAATDALIERWGSALEYSGEACAFWLALADTQWKVGRLEERVRDRALGIIASGEDLARFAHDPRLHKRRRVVLEQLAAQLATSPRAPVRLRRPFHSVSPVAVGDVFSFALPDDRLVFLRCVAISGDERDNHPTVEVLDWVGPEPPREPATILARRPLGEWADLFWLVRYPQDPDPTEGINVIAAGTPVSRRDPLPAQMVPWAQLGDALSRTFGD
jgi:hypothetical protein